MAKRGHMACAVSRPRTSRLRASGTAPAKWGGAVLASEEPHEVAGIAVTDPMADLLNREVGLNQEAPRFRHSALGDPLLHRSLPSS
jgi:hypothetical protein